MVGLPPVNTFTERDSAENLEAIFCPGFVFEPQGGCSEFKQLADGQA